MPDPTDDHPITLEGVLADIERVDRTEAFFRRAQAGRPVSIASARRAKERAEYRALLAKMAARLHVGLPPFAE